MSSDLALVPSETLGVEGDLEVSGTQYKTVRNLETAIRLSLFCDARAREGDDLPQGDGSFGEDLRGWWGSEFLEDAGELGSRLWTLKRSTLTQKTRQRARDYCLEALAWTLELGIAEAVEVTTNVEERGILRITVEVFQADDTPARFAYLWSSF